MLNFIKPDNICATEIVCGKARGADTLGKNLGKNDEAPMAYKSMGEIVEHIKDTVDVVIILKPVYNFKASE